MTEYSTYESQLCQPDRCRWEMPSHEQKISSQ